MTLKELETKVEEVGDGLGSVKRRLSRLESATGLGQRADEELASLKAGLDDVVREREELRARCSELVYQIGTVQEANRVLSIRLSERDADTLGTDEAHERIVDQLRSQVKNLLALQEVDRKAKFGLSANVDELRNRLHELDEENQDLRVQVRALHEESKFAHEAFKKEQEARVTLEIKVASLEMGSTERLDAKAVMAKLDAMMDTLRKA